jgi:hypothetical protein
MTRLPFAPRAWMLDRRSSAHQRCAKPARADDPQMTTLLPRRAVFR